MILAKTIWKNERGASWK